MAGGRVKTHPATPAGYSIVKAKGGNGRILTRQPVLHQSNLKVRRDGDSVVLIAKEVRIRMTVDEALELSQGLHKASFAVRRSIFNG